MKYTLEKAGKCLYYIVIVLVLLIMLNNIISRSDKVFNVIGFRSYTILTGSMEPKIMPGDLVIVKSANENNLKINDVITFNYEGHTVTHRIVERQDNGFTTKGDNNNVADRELVPKEDVIGKVGAVIPKVGYVIIFLAKPIVIVGLLLILGMLILKDTLFDHDSNSKKIDV